MTGNSNYWLETGYRKNVISDLPPLDRTRHYKGTTSGVYVIPTCHRCVGPSSLTFLILPCMAWISPTCGRPYSWPPTLIGGVALGFTGDEKLAREVEQTGRPPSHHKRTKSRWWLLIPTLLERPPTTPWWKPNGAFSATVHARLQGLDL
jgi:hypothetical protein